MTYENDILGTYRHYKGNHYEVLGTAVHSETYELMVLYRTVEGSAEYPAGTHWVRPKKMFFEQVIIDGKSIPRFLKVA